MKNVLTLLFVLLSLYINAQNQISIVTLKSGTKLKGVIKSINPTENLTISIAGIETSIKMTDVEQIEAGNESDNIFKDENANQDIVIERQMVIKQDSLKNYKGFLLEKGNNVYVWGEDNIYGKTGAEELKRLLKIDGFWNVVNSLQDAHFSINYCVKFRKRDQVILTISSWRTEEAEILRIFSENNMEIPNKHIAIARDLYYDEIFPFQEKIKYGDIPTKLWKKFLIK